MTARSFAECPICKGPLTLFASDNPFEIWKCPIDGFFHFNRIEGKITHGQIEQETPYGKGVKGVFISYDKQLKETYYRIPNQEQSGFNNFILLAEEAVKAPQKELQHLIDSKTYKGKQA
jgi:hypothetical protein